MRWNSYGLVRHELYRPTRLGFVCFSRVGPPAFSVTAWAREVDFGEALHEAHGHCRIVEVGLARSLKRRWCGLAQVERVIDELCPQELVVKFGGIHARSMLDTLVEYILDLLSLAGGLASKQSGQ